ncbi:DUF1963 domain-containing protein [Streptomyces sp. NRRL F-5650]|uniref:DUF1963 domain-containing protein n=1 Tax=Streptomyces sp. NRRL F-5650 TaxID=1463868 RepID=UPI001F4220DC|nr:DUF1963 domain-containing protein [Streptomyces sp. NRRL F-5650]
MTSIGVNDVGRLAVEHGLPGKVAHEIVDHMRPCLYLVPLDELSRKEDIRPAARTGGLPSLPAGVEWPDGGEPLVLTVDCAALPGDVLDFELPPDGHLLFFTQLRYEPTSSAVLYVPEGVPLTERPPAQVKEDETWEIEVYEPCTLYPVAGLTLDEDWLSRPQTRAFLDQSTENQGRVDHFKEAVLDSITSQTERDSSVQLGGCANSWQTAPEEEGSVLLAQIQGQGVDNSLYTQTLILGGREDIAARRFESLRYEQEY